MKNIDNNRLINKLIANKLIQDLFSYLSYSHLTFWFRQLPCLDFCQLKPDCS